MIEFSWNKSASNMRASLSLTGGRMTLECWRMKEGTE